jgi:hypothetical protein
VSVPDHRFPVQRVSHEEWLRATAANAAADHLGGHEDTVARFLAGRAEPELAALREQLEEWPRDQIEEHVARTRSHSLAFLVLMLTGACNADCPICFTDRRRKKGELTPGERDDVLRQARALGARYVYVPGEGEPTIDAGFWPFLDTCAELGLEAIVFTNGLLFADARAARYRWGCDPAEAVKRLAQYPVSLYVKYWSTDAARAAEMLGVRPARCPYDEYAGMPVPAGLKRLLRDFPRERLGIEVVVERRNADDVRERIVPFAERHGLARIVEMIQHNGRVLGNGAFDPSSEQARRTVELLSPTSCTVATCKAVVTSRGLLSPRIAILEHQIPGDPVDVRGADLFERLHRTDYLVERRYEIYGCLCETLPAELAPCKLPERTLAPNVPPPALTLDLSHASGRAGAT